MIYTLTLNPSLDYLAEVKDLQLGYTNRTCAENMLPGGKGINVSIVLKNLGVESTAIYYSAGFTGKELSNRIKDLGIHAEEIEVQNGYTRINVKLKSVAPNVADHESNPAFTGGNATGKPEETEINGCGPIIETEDLSRLYECLDRLNKGDILVLAGSAPSGVPKEIYREILDRLTPRGVLILLDTSGEQLRNALPAHPFLIKPNHHEVGEILNTVIRTREEALCGAKKLQELGARNVLISLAGEGAVLLTEEGLEFSSEAPEGTVQNSVGAGDSMLAGFLAGYTEEENMEKAFYLGLSAGSASAFSTDLADGDSIRNLYKTFTER